ncbi:MAG: hypothetical protein M1817_006113 [Caeruleum heppii]|nr:MAG: hypothetical protein M1817_006113 [Caeruleum heppii]
MEGINAKSRLRKAFRYPNEETDDDDDELTEALDEEEQENLIARLRMQNEAHDGLYMNLFLALPLLLIVPFALRLPGSPLLAMLSITSLLSTAYIMRFIPIGAGDVKGKKPMRSNLDVWTAQGGPVEIYLPWLNGAVCALLLLGSLSQKKAGHSEWMMWTVPSAGARLTLKSVDVGELERLKYGYKGA